MNEPIFDFGWVDERTAEVDEAMSTFDAAKELLLRLMWKGEYLLRLLPCHRDDWMVAMGEHRNVLPNVDEKTPQTLPCPKTIYGGECTICDAITYAMSRNLITRNAEIYKGDNEGKGGVKLRASGLSRALLLDFTKADEEKKKPDFGELPAIRIVKFPGMIVQELNKFLRDDRNFGADMLLAWETGHPILVSAGNMNKFYWDVKVLPKAYPVPEQFRDPDKWPNVKQYLPMSPSNLELPYSNRDLLEALEKHQAVIPEFIHKFALAIDIGSSSVPSLPAGKKKDALKKALADA